MTREEAIKNIKEHCYFANLIPRAKEALDIAIKALEQTRWISVSERLPEEAGMYLCSYDYDNVVTSYFDIRMNEFNVFHEQVTAWMSLPEPYQSEIPTGAERSDKE